MNPILLKTLNQYLGTRYSAPEAAHFLAALRVFPLPDRLSMDDWRVHVPMHLLEVWEMLSDEHRLTIYVMAESSTHPYDVHAGPEEPALN